MLNFRVVHLTDRGRDDENQIFEHETSVPKCICSLEASLSVIFNSFVVRGAGAGPQSSENLPFVTVGVDTTENRYHRATIRS